MQTLIEGLRAKGHRVTVLAPAFPKHEDQDPSVIRFPSIRTPFAKDYPLARPPFLATRRLFEQVPIHLVHTHTPFTVGMCGLRWGKARGVPVVTTYHTLYDHYLHYVPLLPKWYIRQRLVKHITYYYNRVAHVITPSKLAAEQLRKYDVKTPITVVPTGIPPKPLVTKQTARQRIGIPSDEKVLLYAGRLAVEKNLELLLKCLPKWKQTIPRVRLHLVGDGPARKHLEDWAKRANLQESVVFHGQVPHEMVPTFLAAADLFVFPSKTETQGLVIGEAQSVGLPAVAVGEGGAAEAITHGHDGLVVPDEPDHFAEAVESLMANPSLLSRMADNALNSSRRLTPEEHVNKIEQIYLAASAKPVHQEKTVGRTAFGP